jgi:hypothetical protein
VSRFKRHICFIGLLLLGACSQPSGSGKGSAGLDIQEPDDTGLVFFSDSGVKDTGVEPDTGKPDVQEPPPDTKDRKADVADDISDDISGSCNEGTPCNDDDPCTVNDQCVSGQCQGSAIDCNDDVPCTKDACVDGLCTHPVADGFCKISGVCYANAQKNPANQCQRCSQPQSQNSWSNVDGGACDDGDLCTGPDVCVGGECATQPIECPDDGNSCTLEICEAGGCVSKASPGECDDGNPCTVGDFCDKKNCQSGTGEKDSDSDGAVDSGCVGGTDCNDNDKEVAPQLAENCEDQKDNNCNGLIDQEEESCKPANPECATHTDCYPLTVCAQWATTGKKTCSEVCAGNTDCGVGQMCSKVPGSTQVGFCQDAPQGLLQSGAVCTDEVQCNSGVCADGVCTDLCLDEGHCLAANSTCHPVGDLLAGKIMGACSPNPPGFKPNGMICLMPDGFSYGGNICASGHCDLLKSNAPACAPLCTSESDCAPAQECNIVLYATSSNPDYVPYHPQFTQPTYDALSACYTPPSPGFLDTGQVCSTNNQCKSYKCLALVPGSITKRCTSFCTGDSECPATMQCKLEAITLSSAWLVDNFNGSQAPAPGIYSLVRICKLP